jgi:Lon protease-like protein
LALPLTTLPNPLPLFPLKTVLFPGALLALKVFETRYLDLMSECLRQGTPFGVVCLRQGQEASRNRATEGRTQLEEVGVLVRIDDIDAEQAGILSVRCTGTQRFRRVGPPGRRENGLWHSQAELMADDPPRAPGPAVASTVAALAEAISKLKEHDKQPFAEPYRLDDAGWVANRWCELLPVSLAAKQKLMALDDPVIRLSLVDGFLRDKKVVVG